MNKNYYEIFIVSNACCPVVEIPPSYMDQMGFFSGFDCAGMLLLINQSRRVLFTYGLYIRQAQLMLPECEILDIIKIKPWDWLKKNARGIKIAYDPRFFMQSLLKFYKDFDLICIDTAEIDSKWNNIARKNKSNITLLDTYYIGENRNTRCQRVGKDLKDLGVDSYLVSRAGNAEWLGCFRGCDMPYMHATDILAVVHSNGDLDLITSTNIHEIQCQDLRILNDINQIQTTILGICENEISVSVMNALKKADIETKFIQNPIILHQNIKTYKEIESMRQCHIRDGRAVTRCLNEIVANPDGFDEIDVKESVLQHRKKEELFQGESFNTISAVGENAAIIHYSVSKETNQILSDHAIFLLDSGGQYLDGTTDITRTIAVRQDLVTRDMKEKFTCVLMGLIDLSSMKFPIGTNGGQLDVIARRHLWDYCIDYNHGTGHGVGFFSAVHEGSFGITKKNDVELKPNMVLSIEPGYYDEFGIRLENLAVVIPARAGWLQFETLTYVKFDEFLILREMMTQKQLKWLDEYHIEVEQKLDI